MMKGIEMEPEIFNVVKTPIRPGVNFIEASAGTGKTYAIAMLVLRAVCECSLDIEKILIVTFTRAAAEELRSRVRARLVEARDLLQGRIEHSDLTAWQRSAVVDESTRERYLEALQRAIVGIDRAAIFTIHGFCQRMLAENALESGQFFSLDLLGDIESLRQKAAEDFWRRHIYRLKSWQCAMLFSRWQNPADLLQDAYVQVPVGSRIEPDIAPIDELWIRFEQAQRALADWWDGCSKELLEELAEACGAEKFKKDFSASLPGAASKLGSFLLDGRGTLPKDISWLSYDGLLQQVNGNKFRGKKAELKQPFVEEFSLPDSEVCELMAVERELFIAYRLFFSRELDEAVTRELEQVAAVSFDDLISSLSAALRDDQSPLKERLQCRYAMALIDEFQDTDGQQWNIFSSLFVSDTHTLYLIGDPKQAIYKFRGADIYSYFAAREEAKYFYTLDTNYRSHRGVVEGVNVLFSSSADPFLFKEEGLLYFPVNSGKSAEIALVDSNGNELAPFVYRQLGENCDSSKGKWTSGKAKLAVQQDIICEALALMVGDKRAFIRGKGGSKRSLRPQDIAVLVRSNSQAESYQQAFLSLGVPAIIAGRKTIIETDECRELLLILQAVLQFDDFRAIKTALTTSLFALTGEQIAATWEDEEVVSEWYNSFAHCNEIWLERGVLAMLLHLVNSRGLFKNLACFSQPERRIANFSHLFEVLQEQESGGDGGPRQTFLWLRSAFEGRERSDAFELRLESDEEALQIVTMHSSKGLQYPVVFCPDLYGRSSRLKNEKNVIACNDDGPVLDFGTEHFADRREQACREELAEDLRLAYVALTRAELRNYSYWADVSGSSSGDASLNSALAYLLFAGEDCDNSAQQLALNSLARHDHTLHEIVEGEQQRPHRYKQQEQVNDLRCRGVAPRTLATNWQITSYSALAGLSDHASIRINTPSMGKKVAYGDLPKGARFGNAVHDVLETISFTELAQAVWSSGVQNYVENCCQRYGLVMEIELFAEMIRGVVSTPLVGENSFALADLAEGLQVKEMEFYMSLARLNLSRLNQLFRDQKTVRSLLPRDIEGYVTGFIDLVFEHDGKYYLLDYKSNYLGDYEENYVHSSLEQAMAQHNYGLQYSIYSLVLHQHLQSFVTDYSYERDFGGVFYLFVRGMGGGSRGVFFEKPEVELIESLDALLGGRS